MAEIQKLELADCLFPNLISGQKLDTVRWKERLIKEGYLLYYASSNPKWKTIV